MISVDCMTIADTDQTIMSCTTFLRNWHITHCSTEVYSLGSILLWEKQNKQTKYPTNPKHVLRKGCEVLEQSLVITESEVSKRIL